MMKTAQALIFILATTLLLQGCIASKPANSRKSLSSSVKNTSNTNKPGSPVFGADEALYWFSSQKVTGTITINKNSENIVYLRGSAVHNFLSSKDASSVEYYRKNYCVVATFSGTSGAGAKPQLKLRAVPISISNFTTKATERLFRIDIPSPAENAATCGVATVDGVVTPSYALAEICPNCLGTNLISTSSIRLYESKLTAPASLTQVSATQLSLSSVALRVDLLSNSTTPDSLCSNSSCEAKGFDCCIEGQCVKDASKKSSAENDPQYSQAMSDYSTNPLSFINYPNIFNVCTNIAHTPPAEIDPNLPTPLSEAEKRVKDYLASYKCVNAYNTGSADVATLCVPSYTEVKKNLAIACGCPATYDQNEREKFCPDWGVRPLFKTSVFDPENLTEADFSNIVDFYCYTPVPVNPIGPITNLNVNVSSRSAPHRFYSTDNKNYDDLSKLSTSIKQEGDDFYYLDDTNKGAPVNGSYNVNSILGRINVGLSQTQPAKMVAVELGKTYIMSTTSGYFTPCSKCAKDSWFQTFSSNPATLGGNGLRFAGYTTSRDTYSANSTLGNYEDTKFGRACYVPVTMLPFSHKKDSNLQTQRMNRLKTQAAYYINGYQRDWFGFNKGAMIGSFDGVTWFAIGSGRRVTATSTKLYLAINGAFLDLADRTDTIVNIIPDVSASVAAEYDFDPALTINDPRQNQAGTCQKFHQCSTDADCVTQLGWEYSCADMSQLRTRWPVYDGEAKEGSGQEKTQTIFEILEGTATIGDSGKRCVYRGAGAPCVRDFTGLNGQFNQKALTCAPNFYCAALTTSRFNDELVRSPNELDDVLFGMDTNILGRPLYYVTASKPLPGEVIANIKYNGASDSMGLTSAQVDDMGICRPGKALGTSAISAHSNPDTSKRTDYISQISSCNSATTSSDVTTRSLSCPAFTSELDYAPYDNTTTTVNRLRAMQNSCGGEAKNSDNISAFKGIEAGTLQLLRNISQPVIVQDACYRRAGSVCHSDLDCSPNKMHGEAVGSLPLSYFGGTQAEQSYWQENLVCAQGNPVPVIGSVAYSNFNLNENRCCREIGKDFTMYTAGPSSIVPENMGTNVTLDTKKFTAKNPAAANRYSRYTISQTALEDSATIPAVSTTAIDKTPEKDQWRVINETGSLTCCGGGWIRKFADGTHDWTIKNRLSLETANFQCLNFRTPLADATYSNYTTDKINKLTYQREYEYFCKTPGQNGCMQILYRDINNYTILPPAVYEPSDSIVPEYDYDTLVDANYSTAYPSTPPAGSTRLDTTPESEAYCGDTYPIKMNQDVPYKPFAYYFSAPYDLTECSNGSKRSLTLFTNKDTDYGVSMYLPAYIPFDTATFTPPNSKIYIKYFYDDNNDEKVDRTEVVNITNRQVDQTKCQAVNAHGSSGSPVDELTPSPALPASNVANAYEQWCVTPVSGRPVMHVKAYTGTADRDWLYASIVIDFQTLEKQIEARNIAAANVYKDGKATVPGNPYYYLTKLGRLELIGIPQITYEPLYCNTNQVDLVPGIFTSTLKTRADFNSSPDSYQYSYNPLLIYDEDGTSESDSTPNVGNFEDRFTFQNKLSHAAIFSSKDFACCTPLGKETASGAKCCSGYATTKNGKMTCKLPRGTDLNVYFNKFVSSEGVGETLPGGGLSLGSILAADEVTSDFNEYTGEPKMREATFQKLEQLGREYCETGVVGNGGAFGRFGPEPFSGYIRTDGSSTPTVFPLSIVDSLNDFEGIVAGKFPFDSGYRWDHHYYCK